MESGWVGACRRLGLLRSGLVFLPSPGFPCIRCTTQLRFILNSEKHIIINSVRATSTRIMSRLEDVLVACTILQTIYGRCLTLAAN